MEFERRGFLLTLLLATTSGCAKAEVRTFGLDAAPWTLFKQRFLLPNGRVVDNGNGGISHSEGQGYGMLLAEAAGDREAFGRIHAWTERALARPDIPLFSWRFTPGRSNPVADRNNATDGDILIAWALLRAGRRWNDKAWLRRSAEIRRAIAERLVSKRFGMTLLMPGATGFEAEDRLTVNPAYYIWPALDAFREEDGDAWRAVIDDGTALLAAARFGPLRLPTDWVDFSGAQGVTPAEGRDPLFGFDAIRVPLYLLMSGRHFGLDAITEVWKGYVNARRPIPAWINVLDGEAAPFPLSPGALQIAGLVTGVDLAGSAMIGDYYSSVLGLLCTLARKAA